MEFKFQLKEKYMLRHLSTTSSKIDLVELSKILKDLKSHYVLCSSRITIIILGYVKYNLIYYYVT